jgi:hypothetical protein
VFYICTDGNPIELSRRSPCLHPVFGAAFTPYPLFQTYPQCKELFIESEYEMLKPSAFNSQGSRLIIVIV